MYKSALLATHGLLNAAGDVPNGGGGASPPPAAVTPPPANTQPVNVPPTVTPPPTPAPVPNDASFVSANSGNTAVDLVLNTIYQSKIDIPDQVWDLAEQGNFAMLQVYLDKGKVAGSSQLISVLQDAYNAAATKSAEDAKAATAAIHEIVGGAEQWGHVNKWFTENASPDEASYIKQQLANPIGARMAAAYLNGLYQTHNGSANRGDAVAKPHVAQQAADSSPISRAELATHANRLYQLYGNSYINSPEYQSLLRRVV